MDDDLKELLNEFLVEAQDILSRVRTSLADYGKAGDPAEQLKEIARGIHTIKGGAGMFSMPELTQRAHKLENYLQQFKSQPAKMTSKHIASVVRFLDTMENLLEGKPDTSAKTDIDDKIDDRPVDVSQEVIAAKEAEETPSAAVTSKSKQTADVLRVSIDRVQKTIDIVTEIFLTRNQMSHLVETMLRNKNNVDNFLLEWDALDNSLRKNIGELEHVAISMRMMPIKSLFQRMEKTVRAYNETSGKQIEIKVVGENTELDKKVLDYLGEPLIHLIRNAMDHGIELPESRLAANKRAQGTISLSAEVRGSEVIVVISDDGKGIDADAVLASARKKGFDVSHVQTKEQAVELIFMPGFSTAATVSEVSGRGVGMDAVKSFVESIGGAIYIQTAIGQGSTFTLHLPLGMSLIPAIIAKINDGVYAISTSDVLETLRLPYDRLLKNGSDFYLDYKGQPIPCYFAEEYLGTCFVCKELQVIKSRLSVCIVRTSDSMVAICVSDFIANMEIATKAMPALAPKISYIVGSSILATGEPVFVISMRRLHQWIIGKTERTHEASHAIAS